MSTTYCLSTATAVTRMRLAVTCVYIAYLVYNGGGVFSVRYELDLQLQVGLIFAFRSFENNIKPNITTRCNSLLYLDRTDCYWVKYVGISEQFSVFSVKVSYHVMTHEWNFVLLCLGTAVAQWLRCCATNRKVAGLIPAGVIGIYHWHKILPIALWSWGRLSL